MAKKTKQGGAREGAGRPTVNYSEELISKKILIPKSKEFFFSELAKSERDKVRIKNNRTFGKEK